MEIERINQRVHLHQGIPAFKAGEWPGSLSSHWSDRGKIVLLPIRRENIILAEQDILYRPNGRKHFKPLLSKESTFKPAIKLIKEKMVSMDK
jgi:hypothetical protein